MDEQSVECHSGYAYAQRPTAIHWGGNRYEVESIQSEWRSPQGKGFRVRTTSGMVFDLFYEEESLSWTITPIPSIP